MLPISAVRDIDRIARRGGGDRVANRGKAAPLCFLVYTQGARHRGSCRQHRTGKPKTEASINTHHRHPPSPPANSQPPVLLSAHLASPPPGNLSPPPYRQAKNRSIDQCAPPASSLALGQFPAHGAAFRHSRNP